jgi:membrane protein CcdC involved in cytochrome C biogenesis
MREDGGVEEGFYVIHRDMYIKAIEAFRAILLNALSYRYLCKFFHSDDVRLMGIPGTVCAYQKDVQDPNVNPLLTV